MSVTLKNLADEAGVSMATVSLALNGSKAVAGKTIARVREIAQKHNFQPNQVARSLASGRSFLLGVLIDSFAPPSQFRLLALIEKVVSQYGYKIMIGEVHDNVEKLHELCLNFRQYGVDGLLILSHDYPSQEKRLKELFYQRNDTVFIGRPRLENVSYIDIDRSKAIREAVFSLHRNGFKHTGLLCESPAYLSAQNKISAFLEAQKELGTASPETLICHFNEQEDYGYQEELLQKWIRTKVIDSLLLQNDIHAAKLCKFLQKKGISIIGNFGIVGSDNDSLCCFCSPELSSIDDALELQAHHAVKLLLESISDKNDSITQVIHIHSKFISRESSQGKSISN